ncbi:MAG: polysaccharide deacetylase family protein [Bacteroidaceae bacterium]|nr:polysaccharide deacetylase family protein [Bacteroidaceae bacterium]
MNILTVDVEEWFHLLDFDATRTEAEWGKYEVRIYENVERLLRILDDTNTKATFFVIGWIAKTYPDLIKKISERYQIGCHTMNHQLVWQQSPDDFRKDVETGVKMLQDITGKKVECFRAPGFSIRESEGWAFGTLAELGIKYDCSVFPAQHAHGGMPSYPKAVPGIIEYKGCKIKEFPVSFKTIGGKHIIFSGGGYFRLCPYPLLKKWSRESSDYLMAYIHPRDLDSGQPMLEGLPISRKFKSYIGLKGAEGKMRRWLNDFKFSDVATADETVDWSNVTVMTLK